MKIALILTGHMRGYQKGYESFKQFVIDPLGRENFDIFIHTWSDIGFYSGKGYLKPRADGYINTEDGELGFWPTGDINKAEIEALYNPIDMVVDDFALYNGLFEEKRKRYVNAYTRPKNTLSQFYKVMLGIQMMKEYADQFHVKYDLVIRARPDVVLMTHLPQINPVVFYTNQGGNCKNVGVGDQLHLSSYDNMVKFGPMYEHIDELYSELGYSCPHAYCQLWLQKQGIPIAQIATPSYIMHGPHGPYNEPDTGKPHVPEK